jgi:hypothetical protein
MKGKKPWRGLRTWIVFILLAALFPLAAVFVIEWIHTGKTPEFFSLFAKGELVLIAIAVLAEAIGDLYSERHAEKSLHDFLQFSIFSLCFVLFFLAAAMFGGITVLGTPEHSDIVALISFSLYVLVIFLAISNKILAIEVAKYEAKKQKQQGV